jgi:hypothetical protein
VVSEPAAVAEHRGPVGVNFSIIPTIKDRIEGAVAVQIKLRVW